MVELRNYQKEVFSNLLKNYDKNNCIQMPTGTGKSRIIECELNYNLALKQRVMVLVPKQQLTHNISRLNSYAITEAYSGHAPDLEKPVLCTTFQSALKYVELFKPDRIINDETHRVKKGGQWDRAMRRAGVPITGYTATPNRLDGQSLHFWYKNLISSHQTKWFIDNQYLAPFKLYTSKAPLFNEPTDSLDLQEKIFIPEIGETIGHWYDVAYGKKTIVFATTIRHAELMGQAFNAIGVTTSVLSHNTHPYHRQTIFNAFKRGSITVLINVELFTEGIDVPDCECVVLTRFTYSTALYLQMVGRVLRYFQDKVAIVLDIANNCFYHGAPDTPFFWSLEGQENIGLKSNQLSLYHRCEHCNSILTHKKHVLFYSDLCCLECKKVNVDVEPFQPKSNKAILHKTFNVGELHELNDTQITEVTRLLRKKKGRPFQETMNAIMALDVPNQIKRKTLLANGFKINDIDFYFDDNDE
jgi:superfamily II DNA or RNA helicase